MPDQKIPLLMTRPQDAAERFVSALPSKIRDRIEPVYAPLMRISTTCDGIDLTNASGMIFTSMNGVNAVSDFMTDRSLPAYCVGEATAEMAEGLGLRVLHVEDDAKTLIATMTRAGVSEPLVHFCGRHTRGDVAENLTAAGCETRRQVVYDQELLPFEESICTFLGRDIRIIAPIFSPRTARQFVRQCPECRNLHLVALSDAVAEPLKDLAYSSLTVADRPIAGHMAAIVENLVDGFWRVERGGGAQ